jgi:hypothetical protein
VGLRDESRTASSGHPTFVAQISVDARSGTEWLYGWRTAVGLGNLLRRAGVHYCLAEQGGADLYANYGVLEKYMKTDRCREVQANEVVEFSCLDKSSFGYTWRGASTKLWAC